MGPLSVRYLSNVTAVNVEGFTCRYWYYSLVVTSPTCCDLRSAISVWCILIIFFNKMSNKMVSPFAPRRFHSTVHRQPPSLCRFSFVILINKICSKVLPHCSLPFPNDTLDDTTAVLDRPCSFQCSFVASTLFPSATIGFCHVWCFVQVCFCYVAFCDASFKVRPPVLRPRC